MIGIRQMVKKGIKKALGIDTPAATTYPAPGPSVRTAAPEPAPRETSAPIKPVVVKEVVSEPAVAKEAAPKKAAPKKATAKKAAPKKAAAKKAAPKKAAAKKAAPKKAAAKKAAPKKAAAKKAAPKKAAAKKAAPKKAAAKKAAPKKAAAKKAAPKKAEVAPTDDTAGSSLNLEMVQEVLDDMVRPALQGDGGDISLIKIEDDNIYVRLVGACNTCPSAIMTMKMGVEALLREEFPSMNELIQIDPGITA